MPRRRPFPIGEIVRMFKGNHPGSHLFKIDNFSLLKKHQIEQCESSVFDIGGYKWKLIVYPKGSVEGYVSIDVEIQDSGVSPVNMKSLFEVKLFCASQFERLWSSGPVDVSHNKWTSERVISDANLNDKEKGFLVDDCALFGVKLVGLRDAKVGTAECFSLVEKPPNHKVTWKMNKFSTFLYQTEHKSDEFVIGGRKWRISIYPRGFKEGQGNSLSAYLCGEGYTKDDTVLKTKTYVDFKLRVLDQIRRKHFELRASPKWFSVEPESWGIDKLITLKDLYDHSKGYLKDDVFHVGVEIDLISLNKSC